MIKNNHTKKMMSYTSILVILMFCIAQFLTLTDATENYPLQLKVTEEKLKQLENRTCHEWNTGPVEDCLQMTEPNCLAVGCVWIANYPGPWCQFPIPSHCIPSKIAYVFNSIERFLHDEFSNMNEIQVTGGMITLLSIIVLLTLMIWAEKKVPFQDLRYSFQEISQASLARSGFIGSPALSKKDSWNARDDEYIEEDNLSPRGSHSSAAVRQRRLRTLSDPEEPSITAGGERLISPSASRSSRSRRRPNTSRFNLLFGDISPNVVDAVCCIIMFTLNEIIRVWRLGVPAALTFDECHFGYFVSHYYKREYLFDIHPPMAKISFFALGNLLGHDPGPNGGDFQFKGQMGTPYHNWYQYFPLRLVATLFGSGVTPVMYLTLRALRVRPAGAIFAATLVIFDSLLLSESRGILTDSQLIFWNAITIYAMMKLFTIPGHPSKEENAANRRLLNKWTIFTAVCCGCVFSIKFTALATLGLVFLEGYFALFIIEKRLSFVRCLVAVSIGGAVWMFWWWLHFLILNRDHSESAWHTPHFQSSLINNPFEGKLSAPWFLMKTYELVYTMIKANAQTLEPHDWGSRWYEWIVGRGRLLSASSNSQELGYTQNWEISIFANPIIAILGLFSIGASVALAMFYSRYQHLAWVKTGANRNFIGIALMCIVGWLTNILPYTGIARSTFVYHYLPGQLYVQVLSAVLIDRVIALGPGLVEHLWPIVVEKCGLDGKVRMPGWLNAATVRTAGLLLYGLLIVLLALSWWFFSPWLYAIPLAQDQHNWRRFYLGR